jgi:glutathione synthase/RimK-type ligase-like ATP-grasp enzyme
MSMNFDAGTKRVLVVGGSTEARFAALLRAGLAPCGVEVDGSDRVETSFHELKTFLCRYDLIFFRIYFRPPSYSSKPLIEAFFRGSEWMNLALGMVAAAEPGRFFNHPVSSLIAESKPLQLETARSVGMTVPDTLFSNDADEIRAFAAARRCILKPVDTSLLAHPDRPSDTLLMFTRELTEAELAADDLISAADSPMIVQALVEKRHELRVVVYGDHVRTIRIDSQAHQDSRLDFRRRLMDPNMYARDGGDSALNEKCVAYCRELRLDSGVFDFAVDLQGEPVFLECNPNGQWGNMSASASADIDAVAIRYFAERLGVAEPAGPGREEMVAELC